MAVGNSSPTIPLLVGVSIKGGYRWMPGNPGDPKGCQGMLRDPTGSQGEASKFDIVIHADVVFRCCELAFSFGGCTLACVAVPGCTYVRH